MHIGPCILIFVPLILTIENFYVSLNVYIGSNIYFDKLNNWHFYDDQSDIYCSAIPSFIRHVETNI